MVPANRELLKGELSDGTEQVDGAALRRRRTAPSVSSMWSTVSREISASHWA